MWLQGQQKAKQSTPAQQCSDIYELALPGLSKLACKREFVGTCFSYHCTMEGQIGGCWAGTDCSKDRRLEVAYMACPEGAWKKFDFQS